MIEAQKRYVEYPKVEDDIIVPSTKDREMAFAFSNLEVEETDCAEFFDFDAYYGEPSADEEKEAVAG